MQHIWKFIFFPQVLEKASWFAGEEDLSHLNISTKV